MFVFLARPPRLLFAEVFEAFKLFARSEESAVKDQVGRIDGVVPHEGVDVCTLFKEESVVGTVVAMIAPREIQQPLHALRIHFSRELGELTARFCTESCGEVFA